jgi:hypothetical protein
MTIENLTMNPECHFLDLSLVMVTFTFVCYLSHNPKLHGKNHLFWNSEKSPEMGNIPMGSLFTDRNGLTKLPDF